MTEWDLEKSSKVIQQSSQRDSLFMMFDQVWFASTFSAIQRQSQSKKEHNIDEIHENFTKLKRF